MDDSTDKVEFAFTLPTPDLLELEARKLPRLDPPLCAPTDWLTRWDGLGFSMRLPDGFAEVESAESDQVTWHHADSSLISLYIHEGGDHCISFGDVDGVEVDWFDEGTFQIHLASRTGRINLARVDAGFSRIYYSSAQAGIRTGVSMLVLIVAPSQDRRMTLLNVIPTITIANQ